MPETTATRRTIRRRARPAPPATVMTGSLAPSGDLTLAEVESVARIGSYSLDVASGRWTSSAGLDAILGIDKAFERTFEGWVTLVHPADRAAMVAYFTGNVLGRGEPFDREYRVTRRDTGATRWVHGRGALTRDPAGRILKMIGTIADVTDQHALREANDKLAQAIAQTTDAILITSPTGTLEFANPAVDRLGATRPGESRGDALGRIIRDLPPETVDDLQRALDARRPWKGVHRYPDADGGTRLAELTISPIVASSGDWIGSVTIGRDITEQINARQALEASEARLRTSLDAMADPFLVCEAIRGEDGAITGFRTAFANRAAEALVDPDPGTHEGAPGGISLLGSTPVLDAILRVIETGEPWVAENVRIGGAGGNAGGRDAEIDIQVARSGDGFLATWQDVTERASLHREREQLLAALEQATDAMAVVMSDGTTTYANPAFLEAWGLVRGDVIGRSADDAGRLMLGAAGLAAMRAAITRGESWRGEVDQPAPDGSARRIEMVVTPARDDNGQMTCFVVTSRDVTALHDAQQRMERRQNLRRAVERVDRRLLSLTDPVEVAHEACRAVVETGEVAMAWVGLIDTASGLIVPVSSQGDTGYLEAVTFAVDASPFGRGPAARAIRRGAPVVVDDIAKSPLMAPWRKEAARHGYRSLAAFPLRHGEGTRGALVVYSAQPGAFSPDDTDVLGQLAGDVALALTRIDEAARRQSLLDALAASERRFRETLAEIAMTATMLDVHGRILFANRHLLELTGRDEAEVVGQDWYDCFSPPDDRARDRAIFDEDILSGTLNPRWRERLLAASGEIREIEWSNAYLRDLDGTIVGIASLGNDITERLEAETALAASEARLRTALDTMMDGVTVQTAIRDDAGRIVDFRIEYSNRSLGGISGLPVDRQVGGRLLELFPAHRANGLFDAYVAVVETGVPFDSGPFQYVDPDAAGGPLDQVLEHRAARLGDGYVLSVRDVTERSRAEREMRHLATAIEQSSDAVVITDADGTIEYVNPAFTTATGYTREEALGNNPRILKSEVQSPAFYSAMWATLRGGASFVGDLTNRRKDGSLFDEEAVISPIRDGSGVITSYVAVKRDVTRERSNEARQMRMARERALIAGTLAELRILSTPAATAEAICRQVVSATGLGSASIFHYTPEGHAAALAFVRADGAPAPLRRIPAQRSRKLRERAEEGPWVEAWVPRPSHPYRQLHAELGSIALAFGPIRHAGSVVGHLAVTSAEADAVARLTEVLPGLLEFAGVTGALLGEGIRSLNQAGRARSRISEIVSAAGFQPVFQPVVDLVTGDYVGFEALTRFTEGTAPDLVFADARAAGLETELELATLRAAVEAARTLPSAAWLSLNVSPTLLAGGRRLARVLAMADRPVVLEVTEHVAVEDYAALRAAVRRLRPPVRVAVDDAGSGVANFGHIVELQPAFVKLDVGLVRGIDVDLTRQALMVGLLHFANESAGQTIAEGVETEAELATLRRLGVPFAQGYLLARPAPAATWAPRSPA